MCDKNTIAGYLNVETGSLIFGFITSISSGLLILVILVVTVAMNFNSGPYRVVFTAVMSAILLLVFISFVFSLLLLNGLLKKSPAYVKAYFIYGIVKSVLYAISSIILIALALPVAVPVIVFCIIYGIILHMIRLTYSKMTSGVVYNAALNTEVEPIS